MNKAEEDPDVDQTVAKLNALAVLERMIEMQKKIDEFHERLEQSNRRITQLQEQMSLQQTLANQIAAHGRGPTV